MFHICLVCTCLHMFNNPLPWHQLKAIGRCNMPNCFTSLQLVICKVCKILYFQHHCQHIDFFAGLGYCFFLPSFELYDSYPLFRHCHSLTCDVLMCAEVQSSFFVVPIQEHGEMKGDLNFPTMIATFQWNFHMF